MSGESLRVPGLLFIDSPDKSGESIVHAGPSVGWVVPRGLRTWSREITVVSRAELTESVRAELNLTLPEELPAVTTLPHARRAAAASSLLAVDPSLVEPLLAKGARIHTIGFDRVTADLFYFAKGGNGPSVSVQGNLFEMIAPALSLSPEEGTLETCLDGLIDRILAELSGGSLTEESVELAAALSAVGEGIQPSTETMQALEGYLVLAESRASEHEAHARAVAKAVEDATRRGRVVVEVPRIGVLHRRVQPALDIQYDDGESGQRRRLTLPERSRWSTGLDPEESAPKTIAPPAPGAEAAKPEVPPPNVFVGSVRLEPMRIPKLARRIASMLVDHLSTQPGAEVTVTLEIRATAPNGLREGVVRAVSDAAKKLNFSVARFGRE